MPQRAYHGGGVMARISLWKDHCGCSVGSGRTGAKVGFHVVVIREKVVAALRREEGALGNMQA